MPGRPKPIQAGAIAGCQAAILIFFLQLLLQGIGLGGAPNGVAGAHAILHLQGMPGLLLGLALFCLSGALWGALYAAVVPVLTPRSGILFCLIPWLCAVLFVQPLLGHFTQSNTGFGGALLSLIENIIGGAFLGYRTPFLAEQ